jgi:hypothetical protein
MWERAVQGLPPAPLPAATSLDAPAAVAPGAALAAI